MIVRISVPQWAVVLLYVMLYIGAAAGTARWIEATLCDESRRVLARSDVIFAGLFWPVVLPMYTVASSVPCRNLQ